MPAELIEQLRTHVRELLKLPAPTELVSARYAWTNECIDSPNWKYSVQYISCITFARALFFDGNEVLYDNIQRYSSLTGHQVKLEDSPERMYVHIHTPRETIMFSHAYDFEVA